MFGKGRKINITMRSLKSLRGNLLELDSTRIAPAQLLLKKRHLVFQIHLK
jgi:hypothetical protein